MYKVQILITTIVSNSIAANLWNMQKPVHIFNSASPLPASSAPADFTAGQFFSLEVPSRERGHAVMAIFWVSGPTNTTGSIDQSSSGER